MRDGKTALMSTQQGPSNPSRKARYGEAAEYIGIPVTTLYALVSQGRIPHYRYGPRFVLFDLDELDEWMRERRVRVRSEEPGAAPSEQNDGGHGGDR